MGKRFLHNRAAVVTVAFVLLIALIGILAPLLAPHDPYVTDILNKFAPYSLEYPLGTDHLGRCVLSRLIYGIRPTLGLALLTMLGTIALGALLGVGRGLLCLVYRRRVRVLRWGIGCDPFPVAFHGTASIPVVIDWTEIAWQGVKAFVMVVVASIIPALITARQDPARSLRSM